MKNKKKYMKQTNKKDKQLKELFLKQYNKYQKMLNLKKGIFDIDDYSLEYLKNADIKTLMKKRINNGEFLFNQLRKISIKTLYTEYKEYNVPLFIPILLPNDSNRKKMRNFMIDNEVYLPIHWPKHDILFENNNPIYDRQLSLVCDHRYQKEDMQRIVELLKEFE